MSGSEVKSVNGYGGPQYPAGLGTDRPGGCTESLLAQLRAVARLRCPRCREGRIFRGRFDMNDPCPVCGLIFQREEGYFLGAMYASYLISSVMIGVLYVPVWLWLADWHPVFLIGMVLVLYLPFVPAVFRYSRVIWIHFERWGCPSDVSAGSYERFRQRTGPRE